MPQDALDAFLSLDAEHEFVLRARAAGRSRADARVFARDRIASLGLASRAKVPIHRLSAGERRRLALSAVQTHDPAVLLLDEPFNHLDDEWRPRLAAAMQEAAATRLVMAATHDPRPLLHACRRVLVLRDGRIIFDGAPEALTSAASEFPELRLAPDPAVDVPTPVAGDIVVHLRDVHHEADGTRILHGVSAELGVGLHTLVGPNGSGKTTLLRLIAGLEAPRAGTITVNGIDPAAASPRERCRSIALQFDDPTSVFFEPDLRAEVAFQPTNQAQTGCDVNAVVREALFDLELDGLATRHPWSLSGGERERLALACTAAARTRVVLLDEPAQGLDAFGRTLLRAFLRRVATQACVIVATHDPEVAAWGHASPRMALGRWNRHPHEVSP